MCEVNKGAPQLDILVVSADMLTWEHAATSDGWEHQPY